MVSKELFVISQICKGLHVYNPDLRIKTWDKETGIHHHCRDSTLGAPQGGMFFLQQQTEGTGN
jgi:hypothetical protein